MEAGQAAPNSYRQRGPAEDAGAAAGVAQLIVVSVSTAELADSIFGNQFEEIERGVVPPSADGAIFAPWPRLARGASWTGILSACSDQRGPRRV